MAILDIPQKIIKIAQQKINQFIWNEKIANVKRNTLISSFQEGGLKAPDLESQNKALRLVWLNRLSFYTIILTNMEVLNFY